jgi:mRNA interferase MazF
MIYNVNYVVNYMATKSITITVEESLIEQSDSVVSRGVYPNRSRFIEDAIAFPITSKQPKAVYSLIYELPEDLLPKPSWVKISQIRTLSTDRLGDFIVNVGEEDLEQILSGFDRLVGRRRD